MSRNTSSCNLAGFVNVQFLLQTLLFLVPLAPAGRNILNIQQHQQYCSTQLEMPIMIVTPTR